VYWKKQTKSPTTKATNITTSNEIKDSERYQLFQQKLSLHLKIIVYVEKKENTLRDGHAFKQKLKIKLNISLTKFPSIIAHQRTFNITRAHKWISSTYIYERIVLFLALTIQCPVLSPCHDSHMCDQFYESPYVFFSIYVLHFYCHEEFK